jgi:hypothetical protein
MCAGYERDPDRPIARIGCFHFHPYVINSRSAGHWIMCRVCTEAASKIEKSPGSVRLQGCGKVIIGLIECPILFEGGR